MNNSALQRLAHKAGLIRISSIAYDEMRSIAEMYVSAVVKYAVIYMEHEKKTTIFPEDIAHAIELAGFSNIYKVTGEVKPCKISSKKTIIGRLREYQSQHDCFTMAKAPIEKLLKETSLKYTARSSSCRWSKESITTMHAALEFFIYKIFSFAMNIMLHAKRVTLSGEDLSLTMKTIQGACKSITF